MRKRRERACEYFLRGTDTAAFSMEVLFMDQLPVQKKMDNYLKVLKALADETRLRIINLLYERELCVCDLEAILGTTQTKISRHLAYLRNADLVRDRKFAQWSFYSLNRSNGLKFVDELIREVLRSIDVCQRDLNLLKKKEKAGLCQTNIAIKRRIS
jgi:DNA-binding transcriptional ArsR family regulator